MRVMEGVTSDWLSARQGRFCSWEWDLRPGQGVNGPKAKALLFESRFSDFERLLCSLSTMFPASSRRLPCSQGLACSRACPFHLHCARGLLVRWRAPKTLTEADEVAGGRRRQFPGKPNRDSGGPPSSTSRVSTELAHGRRGSFLQLKYQGAPGDRERSDSESNSVSELSRFTLNGGI